MIDRAYIALLALAAILIWPGMDALAWPLAYAVIFALVFALVVFVPVALWQWGAEAFGGPTRAPFLTFRRVQDKAGDAARARRRAMARRLVDTYGLDLTADPPGPRAALLALIHDAVQADASVPLITGTPLRVDLLGRVLAEVSGGTRVHQIDMAATLSALTPMTRPMPFWRRGWAALRRGLSPLVLPRTRREAVAAEVAPHLVHTLAAASRPVAETPAPFTPTALLSGVVARGRESAGLPALPVDEGRLISDLPLYDQRTLSLVLDLLNGAAPRGLMLRYPSRTRQIGRLVGLVARARGHAPEVAPPPPSEAELAAQLATCAAPAILLRRVWPPVAGQGRSYLGGQPDLPDGARWPCGPDGAPLAFVARIDCADLAGLPGADALPDAGALLLFTGLGPAPAGAAAMHLPSGHDSAPRPWPLDLRQRLPLWPVTPVAITHWQAAPPALAKTARAAQQAELRAHLPKGITATPAVVLCDGPDHPQIAPELLATGWPWCGAVITQFFAALIDTLDTAGQGDLPPDQATRLRSIRANADKGAARFAALTDAAPVAEVDRLALIRWINGGLRAGAGAYLGHAIRAASLDALRAAITDTGLRPVIPASAAQHFAADLVQRPGVGCHLLVPGPQAGPEVTLLRLMPDPGLGLDLPGPIDLRLPAQALAAGDFSALRAVALPAEMQG